MAFVIISHLAVVYLPLRCFHSFIFKIMVGKLQLVRKALCGSIACSTLFTMLKQFSLLDQCLLTIQNNSLLKALFLALFHVVLFQILNLQIENL